MDNSDMTAISEPTISTGVNMDTSSSTYSMAHNWRPAANIHEHMPSWQEYARHLRWYADSVAHSLPAIYYTDVTVGLSPTYVVSQDFARDGPLEPRQRRRPIRWRTSASRAPT